VRENNAACGPIESNLFGVRIRESEFAVRTAFRVVKTHPGARRKRYTVQRFAEPCALVVDGVWILHPTIAAKLRSNPQVVWLKGGKVDG